MGLFDDLFDAAISLPANAVDASMKMFDVTTGGALPGEKRRG